MRWGIYNLKHKELYEWYNNQPEPKVKRAKFSNRIFQYWYSKEDALKDVNWMSLKKEQKTELLLKRIEEYVVSVNSLKSGIALLELKNE